MYDDMAEILGMQTIWYNTSYRDDHLGAQFAKRLHYSSGVFGLARISCRRPSPPALQHQYRAAGIGEPACPLVPLLERIGLVKVLYPDLIRPLERVYL